MSDQASGGNRRSDLQLIAFARQILPIYFLTFRTEEGGRRTTRMSNPGTAELLVFSCLALITGVPFAFRSWLASQNPVLVESIDRRTNRLSLLIFAALFAGAFLYPRHSWKVAQILLGASILSFSLLYQFRARYLARLEEKHIRPEASLRQSAARLSIGLGLCLCFSLHPLLILLTPFALPFLMPLFLRLQCPCRKLEDPGLREEIFARFHGEGMGLSEIYLIDDSGSGGSTATAWIAGTALGRGPFGRSLFIGLDLFRKLGHRELNAVILHEAAHARLGHLSKRIFGAILYLVLCTFWLVLPTAFLLPGETGAWIGSSLLALGAQCLLSGRMIHRQELEADAEAVRMGASSDALASALITLQPQEGPGNLLERIIAWNPYPTTRERIEALEQGPKTLAPWIPGKAFLSAYSMLVIGILLWSAQQFPVDSAKFAHSASSEVRR